MNSSWSWQFSFLFLRLQSRIKSSFRWNIAFITNVIITWRTNVEINIFIWNEIIKIEKINQIETIETTNEEKKTTKTMTITIATIVMMTTRTLKNFINYTSSCFSKRYRQWASCSLKSFFKFLTTHAFNTTFERNWRLFYTRRSTNSFRSVISRNQFTLWNKERFAWFAKLITNKWTFHFSTFFTFWSVF